MAILSDRASLGSSPFPNRMHTVFRSCSFRMFRSMRRTRSIASLAGLAMRDFSWTIAASGGCASTPEMQAGPVGPVGAEQAEQDIGMRKLQPKISGRCRTRKGAIIFPRLRSIVNTARKREWNVIDILGGSPERVVEALDCPAEVLDAFENCLKGEGVDVEELAFVDKKDKAARQS